MPKAKEDTGVKVEVGKAEFRVTSLRVTAEYRQGSQYETMARKYCEVSGDVSGVVFTAEGEDAVDQLAALVKQTADKLGITIIGETAMAKPVASRGVAVV